MIDSIELTSEYSVTVIHQDAEYKQSHSEAMKSRKKSFFPRQLSGAA
jgi:hypothetical protein